jgi:tRNA pseudouridine55 synthase
MSDDIVLIDKPAGWTSFDVVAKLRGSIRAEYRARGEKPTKRQQKVGHAGTLDPFATGLLVILIGDACSRASEFLKLDKVYETTIELGATSSTGDVDGEITNGAVGRVPTRTDVEQVIARLQGEIEQTPPVYSAIKIDGERAYKRARKGEKIEMPRRKVMIYSLEILEYTYPKLVLRTHVSSGTYIRTLAEDIGQALGTGAYCQTLRRTRIGKWSIDNAQDVETATTSIVQSLQSELEQQ